RSDSRSCMSPVISSAPKARRKEGSLEGRTRARTRSPRAASCSAMWLPKRPVAPVMALRLAKSRSSPAPGRGARGDILGMGTGLARPGAAARCPTCLAPVAGFGQNHDERGLLAGATRVEKETHMASVLCEVHPGVGTVAISVAVRDTSNVRTFLEIQRDF